MLKNRVAKLENVFADDVVFNFYTEIDGKIFDLNGFFCFDDSEPTELDSLPPGAICINIVDENNASEFM